MLSIRTQDRLGLIPYNNPITTQESNNNFRIMLGSKNSNGLLGSYKTKERALEVLDEIQKCLKEHYQNSETTRYNTRQQQIVYQMPKE